MNELLDIHHISAFTKSKEDNHFFYTEVLGLRLVKNTVHQDTTHIRHLFYGDYKGSPGTLLTFFELPRAGNSYLEDNYFSTVSLRIPAGSLPYWKERLAQYRVQTTNSRAAIAFSDPDGMPLKLVESAADDTALHPTKHTSIPADKQIVKLDAVEIAVADTAKEARFLENWLHMKQARNADSFTNERETFTLHLKQTASSKATRFGKGAIDHLALAYRTLADLKQKKSEAEALGLTVEKMADRGYFSALYVQDPFGQRFELASLEPGFSVDEPLDKLGETLALPDFLEPKRQDIEARLDDWQLS